MKKKCTRCGCTYNSTIREERCPHNIKEDDTPSRNRSDDDMLGLGLGSMLSDTGSTLDSSSDSSSFDGGGGSFDGGGSSGDW